MGLDMYLNKKTYVKNWDFMKPEELHTVEVKKAGEPHPHIKPERVSYIIENVGYWRKANHIHRWFVQNVQDGVDECQESYVDPSKMQELVDLCEKVIENPELGPELLPTGSGFFFGSTDYDEYYIQDLQDTVNILKPLIEESKFGGDFYYQSSW